MFNVVPHIGISMLKLAEAVIVSAVVPEVVFSVGERPPSIGATAVLAAADGRGSPVQVGELLIITLLT